MILIKFLSFSVESASPVLNIHFHDSNLSKGKLTGWDFKEYGITLRQALELEDYMKRLGE